MDNLEKAIRMYGDEVRKDYETMRINDFLKTYGIGSATIKKHGWKKKRRVNRPENEEESRHLVYIGSIRDGIRTDKWEQPKENRYWEKDGGEIREMGYMKTRLLPDTH